MTDYRAELQRLVEAYEEHGGKWPDHHEQALFQAVEAARTALSHPEPAVVSDEAPENVDELVSEKLPDLRQNLETVIRCSRAYDGYSTMTPIELTDRIIDAVVSWHPSTLPHQRAALAQLGPVVVSVAVSDALIKAECALSDVAEGEPVCDDGDPAQWAEQRCAETLAIIRPVMKLHKIRTSEWPP